MSRPLAFTDHARAWLPARWDAPLESSPARERWNPQGRSREPGTGRQIRPRHRPVSSAPFRGCMIRRKFPALARWAIFCRPWRGSPSGGGARLPVAGLAFRWRGSPSVAGLAFPWRGSASPGKARLPVAGLAFRWRGSPSLWMIGRTRYVWKSAVFWGTGNVVDPMSTPSPHPPPHLPVQRGSNKHSGLNSRKSTLSGRL